MKPARHHLIALATTLACGTAAAANRTWDGNGATDAWSFSAGLAGNTNWTHATPGNGKVLASGDRLIFTGTQRRSSVNDYDGLSLSGLVFDTRAGSFSLSGKALTLTGDLLNQSAQAQTLSFTQLVVGADQHWAGGSAGLTVNAFQLGDHRLVLEGRVNAKTTELLRVGNAGDGTLIASAGVALKSAGAWVGAQAGSTGRVSLSGGAQWQSDGLFYLGLYGAGQLVLDGGASLQSQGGHLGRFAGSDGVATLAGSGTQWTSTGQALRVGYQGHGALNVNDGALLRVEDLRLGELAGGDGMMTLRDANSRLEADRLFLGGEGSATLTIADGAQITVGDLRVLGAPGGNSNLGMGQGHADVDRLLVDGQATVTVTSSGSWTGRTAQVGSTQPSGRATLNISGNMQLSDKLQVGIAQNDGAVNIEGGMLKASAIEVGGRGTLRLAVGRLETGSLQFTPGASFLWQGGTLALPSASLGAGQPLGSMLQLGDGMALALTRELTLPRGSVLAMAAGAQLAAGEVQLQGGMLVANTLDMGRIERLSGQGVVLGRVQGGAGHVIDNNLGALQLGDVTQTGAWGFDGQLRVAGHTLVLDAGLARLGSTTEMGNGVLGSVNGLELAAGTRLDVGEDGSARIEGRFVNNGRVGTADTASDLVFTDMVSGRGSFAGVIGFEAGYDPAGFDLLETRNGPSASWMGFGSNSELFLDVGADGRHDMLWAKQVALNGEVVLRLDAGLANQAPGSLRVDLIDAYIISGSPRLRVVGLDPARVDLSRFARDGSITISAVPEVPSGWSALSGALLLAGLMKRRQQRDGNRA